MNDGAHKRSFFAYYSLNMVQLKGLEYADQARFDFVVPLLDDQRTLTFMNHKDFNALMGMKYAVILFLVNASTLICKVQWYLTKIDWNAGHLIISLVPLLFIYR